MLPFVTRRYKYPHRPDTAARKLSQQLQKTQHQEITGDVYPEGVKLERGGLFSRGRNSFNPIFVGRFEADGNGSVLVGRFRFHWFIIIFICCVYGMLTFELINAVLEPAHVPGRTAGWRDSTISNTVGMAVGVSFFVLFGWIVGLGNQSAIDRAIRESAATA